MPSCPHCAVVVPSGNEFTHHVERCQRNNNNNNQQQEMGTCPMCNVQVPLREIEVHIDAHLAENVAMGSPQTSLNNNNNNNNRNAANTNNNTSKCPYCQAQVPLNQLDAHVNAHLDSGDAGMLRWNSGTNSASSTNNSNSQQPSNNNMMMMGMGSGANSLPDNTATIGRTNLARETGDWRCTYCSILLPIELRDIHLKAHNKKPSKQSSVAPTPLASQQNMMMMQQQSSGNFNNNNSQRTGNKRRDRDGNDGDDVVIQLMCPFCKKIFDERDLDAHMKIHDEEMQRNKLIKNSQQNNNNMNDDDDANSRNSNNTNLMTSPPRPQANEPTRPCPLCFKNVKESLWAWHVQSCGVEITVDCAVCWDEIDVAQSFSFNCSHKVCRECAGRLLDISITGGSLAACPVSDCRQTVSSMDVTAFFGQQNPMAKKYAEIELRQTLESSPAIMTCGTPNCPNQVLLDEVARVRPTCFRCTVCRSSTCTLCRAQPFHYRLSCDASVRARAKWLGALATICGGKNGSNNLALELKEKMGRYKELQEDEKLKARTCRLCSKCGRIIEKLDGCDSMICGRNAHGGGVQNGCGASLNWATLKPYVPKLENPPQGNAIQKMFLTTFTHSEFDRCTTCKDVITGPRFLCANCPEEISFCLKCISKFHETKHRDHFFEIIVNDEPRE